MTEDEIRKLPRLGGYTNEWRQRYIELFRLSEGKVISIGTGITGKMKVIAEEIDQDHQYALAAWTSGNFKYRAH